jgi:hypothetical protein
VVFTEDGLSGVIGERVVLAVDGWGDGVIGDRFVGEVTERDEMLIESDDVRSIAASPREG